MTQTNLNVDVKLYHRSGESETIQKQFYKLIKKEKPSLISGHNELKNART